MRAIHCFSRTNTTGNTGRALCDLTFQTSYVRLMFDRFAERQQHDSAIERLSSEMHVMNENMQAGFARMDRRFLDMDKRFDDVNKKFTMLTALMALMFTVLGGMMTALNLLAG